MLSDFLTLEVYFGSPNAALYFEDLVKNYGQKRTQSAIDNGDIQCRALCNAKTQSTPRILTWLSEQGRIKAQNQLSS